LCVQHHLHFSTLVTRGTADGDKQCIALFTSWQRGKNGCNFSLPHFCDYLPVLNVSMLFLLPRCLKGLFFKGGGGSKSSFTYVDRILSRIRRSYVCVGVCVWCTPRYFEVRFFEPLKTELCKAKGVTNSTLIFDFRWVWNEVIGFPRQNLWFTHGDYICFLTRK
jgi:hypothetical protein